MRNVTLKQLRLLRTAARDGSFAAAAAVFHLTPPAVTMQMHQLETEAGLQLFERVGRRLTLTAAGREVLAAAERIDVALADCTESLVALTTLNSGSVTLGAVSTAKYFVPRMLAGFARNNPQIHIELVIGNRDETIMEFSAGRFDVTVMGRPPEGMEVESAPIGDHPYVFVAPPSHPLARCRRIAAIKLATETILMREPGSGTRMLAERFLTKSGIAPRIGMQIWSNETIKQAVIAGLGIAFISTHTIEAEIKERRLVVLNVAGLPEVRRWFVVRPTAKRLMPAARALRDFLTAEGRRFLPNVLK